MSDVPADAQQSGPPPWLAPSALLVLLALSFLGLNHGLWTPDEPREAEISREMLLSPGVIPTLNGTAFIEKPPLYYWMVAGVFRLAGAASPLAARVVSAAAGFLTLLLVFRWGRRAHSVAAGLIACLMLATSFQFMLSTHWVLIDPLLMLFTTTAAWAAWELLRGNADWRVVTGFYLALVLALWTKGLIGPVLIGAGLATYTLIQRRSPWQPLRLAVGSLVMGAALASLAAAIYLAGGRDAVWQWAWVNHVLRFVHPRNTGHAQPLAYYLWTLPFALLPWLVPLLDALRPARWRTPDAAADLYRYSLVMAGAMLLLLSAASTKRGIYLLPVLPLVFLAFAVNALRWRDAHVGAQSLGPGWSVQAALVGAFALAPSIAALVYLGRPVPAALTLLVMAIAMCTTLVVARRRGNPDQALLALAGCVLVATTGFLVLVPRTLDHEKDMAPFVAWVDQQIPALESVYAVGADESLLAIVPFVTGRSVISLDADGLAALKAGAPPQPEFVLVQSKHSRSSLTELGSGYHIEGRRNFGRDRNLALWQRGASPEARP